MRPPRVGIVITTRNRREILRFTLARAFEQDYPDFVVAVFDDASDDGTEAMIRAEFPEARVERNERPLGYIVNRNRAATMLDDCRYLVSLDDDSWMLRRDAVSRVVAMFSAYPDAALLSFEVFGSYHMPLDPVTSLDGAEIASFAGCGYAVDRGRFLALGAFPECFEFYGEENDFVLRVIHAGLTCRFAPMIPVYHAETVVGRNEDRIREFSLANTLTHVCLREPWPVCLPHMMYVMLHRGLKWGMGGNWKSVVAGVGRWITRLDAIRSARAPVTYSALRRYRSLQRQWRDYILNRRSSTAPRQSVALPGCLEKQ